MSIDEQKRQEYIRRLEAGESASQLTAELENPWIELAGLIKILWTMFMSWAAAIASSAVSAGGSERADGCMECPRLV